MATGEFADFLIKFRVDGRLPAARAGKTKARIDLGITRAKEFGRQGDDDAFSGFGEKLRTLGNPAVRRELATVPLMTRSTMALAVCHIRRFHARRRPRPSQRGDGMFSGG